MPYETLHTETLYHGRAFNVRRDEIRLPDGKTARLEIVDHVGAVTLVPVDDQNRVWFVRQYRHPAGEVLLELPAGMVELGEAPLDCARREIREEIGMAAGRIELIGEFYLAPGYSTEFMHVFLATDLHPDPLPGDADEFISVEPIPLEVVLRTIESGKIRDAKTLASLMLAKRYFV
jgi:ADP-ribose pyrophosphatase